MSKILITASLIAVTTLTASAQEIVRSSGAGITEQGRSTIALPADRLRIVVRSYGIPQQNGVPVISTSATDAEKSVVDAMRANGIPDARVVAPVLGSVTANDQIAGTIAKPTHDRVADIEQRIVAALPPAILPSVRNVNLEGTLEVDTCAPAIERARIAAYADARKRADALALAAGVHLGSLVNASETDQTQGCADFATSAFFGTNGQAIYEGTISIGVTVSATFAIKP